MNSGLSKNLSSFTWMFAVKICDKFEKASIPKVCEPEMDSLLEWLPMYDVLLIRVQWSGKFLGITTGRDPGACKSNRLHVHIHRFSFIKLKYIL